MIEECYRECGLGEGRLWVFGGRRDTFAERGEGHGAGEEDCEAGEGEEGEGKGTGEVSF